MKEPPIRIVVRPLSLGAGGRSNQSVVAYDVTVLDGAFALAMVTRSTLEEARAFVLGVQVGLRGLREWESQELPGP